MVQAAALAKDAILVKTRVVSGPPEDPPLKTMSRENLHRCAAILLMSLCCAFSSQAAEPRSFYEGKTITLIISTSPGGATDVAGRLAARYLGKYIPGQPNIIGQNMPGAGGIVSANYMFNVAKPDGLTILAVSRANYLEQMVGRPEVKLDFRKLNWIGSFNRAPMMIACRKDTPYTSIEGLRSTKSPARFGEGGTGSISYVFSSLAAEILDFKVKHVTGYGSAREIDLGVERGEADCRATSDIALVRPPWPIWAQHPGIGCRSCGTPLKRC